MSPFYSLHWTSPYLWLFLPSHLQLWCLYFNSPRVTISSEGLSWLNFSSTDMQAHPTLKISFVWWILLSPLSRWGSEAQKRSILAQSYGVSFGFPSGQLQSHRCWYSFTDRIKSLPSPKSCVKLEINDRWDHSSCNVFQIPSTGSVESLNAWVWQSKKLLTNADKFPSNNSLIG